MPELPEVEIVKNNLQILSGMKLYNFFRSEKNLHSFNAKTLPEQNNFLSSLLNKKLLQVKRRAKYLVYEFSDGINLVIHLGMSGTILVQQDHGDFISKKHDHLILFFVNELDEKYIMSFNDPRRFGVIDYFLTKDILLYQPLVKLGYEPLNDENFDEKILFNLLQDKKINIKNFLMDGTYVVGIGNIYASEILFVSRISPLRLCNEISYEEVEKLFYSIKSILEKAIKNGGSSIQIYRNGNGEKGSFSQFFRVYDREGRSCFKCGQLIKKIIIAGRSTYYCPKCQS